MRPTQTFVTGFKGAGPRNSEFRVKIGEQFFAGEEPIAPTFGNRNLHPIPGRESMKLIEGFDSNYRYILVAARRARQLQSGAPPVVQTNSRKPCRIAQDEIRAGKVKWEIPETRSAAEQAAEVLDQAFGHDA
jgi:DNA-directed RNA polymerase subunit omega